MTKLLYAIIAILLAITLFMFFDQQDMMKTTKELYIQHQDMLHRVGEQQNTLNTLQGEMESMRDSLDRLNQENEKLKKNPIIITKTIKKNEKIVPVSEHASKYYNSILAKRYQDK